MDQGYLFEGTLAEGFVTTRTLYWADYDIPGYIGYLPSNETIYVVMRATISDLNEQLDRMMKKVPYTKWPECEGCKVHEGFYSAVGALNDETTAEVKRLQELNPTFSVRVTGHSLGASLAQLMGMALIKDGVANVGAITFAPLSVGNKKYKNFSD